MWPRARLFLPLPGEYAVSNGIQRGLRIWRKRRKRAHFLETLDLFLSHTVFVFPSVKWVKHAHLKVQMKGGTVMGPV